MLKKEPRRFAPLLLLLLLPLTVKAAAPEDYSSTAGSPFIYGLPAQTALPVALLPVPQAVETYRANSSGHYLAVANLDLTAVPAAPANGSAQDKQDINAVLDWQARRTAAQCDAARKEMSHSYEVFFGKMALFGSPTPKQVTVFFGNVSEDSVAAHKFLKDVYQRPRPAARDPRVKPCLPNVAGFAYPSGHAAMSRLFAYILGDLIPARRNEFLARADEASLNRIIGGVHHPTDIAAGTALAGALYKNLLKNPQFLADLNAIRPLLR
jgi:acid phosphatase (class A)